MFSQILVPLDGSAFGEQALSVAVELARRSHARLHLVKVHVPPPLSAGVALLDQDADRASYEAEASWLWQLSDSVRERGGLEVEAVMLTGEIAASIEQYVRDYGIGMVVMSTHGRGGLSRAWFGSVTDALVRNLDVPVLALRPRAGPAAPAWPDEPLHILVPLDGSAASEQALGQAAELGSLFDARYTALQVVAPPFGLEIDALAGPLPYQHGESEQVRNDALAYLENVVTHWRVQGLAVETAVVIQPNSAAGILEEAALRRADLIVMSSHGRRGWQRLALGSVADKVLRGAAVPVLVFRADALALSPAEPPLREVLL